MTKLAVKNKICFKYFKCFKCGVLLDTTPFYLCKVHHKSVCKNCVKSKRISLRCMGDLSLPLFRYGHSSDFDTCIFNKITEIINDDSFLDEKEKLK